MNIKLIGMVLKVAPKIKSWFFADGKFQMKRSLVLLVALVLLMVGSFFFDGEQLTLIIGLLDEVSDVVGYAE